ncbi:Aspartokinase [Enhygromyxa salina]|uniref:Aspartokinase n=1 Tax=Enhygromyxa salina TaxID=215803 RepID=A0A0C1ZVJ2_9BACT|nr:aspartate kinase [Enhygromyxa salina]KIG15083.1 Aspartokinase [Enhygromyxa salina]
MLVVQKFGGTSVGTLERIRGVAERVLARQRSGDRVVVVVSAMAGETNRLIELANALHAIARDRAVAGASASAGKDAKGWVAPLKRDDPGFERELSQLMSTGEKVSAALVSMAIQDLGGASVSLVGHQLGVVTQGSYTNARIVSIDAERIHALLDAGMIVVCAGFQGLDEAGDVTTLGRGGSDTSAVALAAAIVADECEILTDVDGVFTSDPRVVPSARKLDRITHEEMLELASLGSKVVQIRAVEFAMKFNVPVHVRHSQHLEEGTRIVPETPNMEAVLVAGVALDRDEAKVTLTNCPDVPGTIATLFTALGERGIIVDMIIQNASRDGKTDVTFTVPQDELQRTTEVIGELELVCSPGVTLLTDANIAKISIVGVGMRTHAGVAAKAFSVLAREGVNIQMVSTSEIKVSVVVDDKYGELALRALHDGFGLGAS